MSPRQSHKFYDTTLNPNVGYAKHAISIDENRADLKRVGWSPTAEKQDVRDAHGNLYFEQSGFRACMLMSAGRLSRK
ncbi:phospholipase effector Tle1 domain-containing protein [Bradyrhizobium liaoningense]